VKAITSADGTTLRCLTTGSGPPLLLVHGTTADHSRWQMITPQLAEHFTVYVMDLRGRGESTDGPEYHLLREAEDVAAVVSTIGEPVMVLGHSYGAVCSLEAALLTDRIDKLVLYEPPIPTGVPMYPPDLPDRMQTLIDGDQWEAALVMFFTEVVRMPEHELGRFRRLPTWERRVQLAPTIPRELAIDRTYRFESGRFADLRTPTLLLLGGDSPELFQRATEVVNEAVAGSTVVVLPGQQHIAMDTNPELFLGEVIGFLTG
jgi:pimeloyl-ACP methyl ester carboxylesterase